ncbi:unnamed protein product, partial [Cercopithifilaria johnstoni]
DITPKTSPTKGEKSTVPTAKPKKNIGINGGGRAMSDKVKEKVNCGNADISRKTKLAPINIAEIVEKAEETTKENVTSRLRTSELDANESSSEIPTNSRKSLQDTMKSAGRKMYNFFR